MRELDRRLEVRGRLEKLNVVLNKAKSVFGLETIGFVAFTIISSLYRISRMGGATGINWGTFLHWRNQKFRVFSNSKIFKNV